MASSQPAVPSGGEAMEELPFLVTHWLANYNISNNDNNNAEAVERIRRASAELASAFSFLGAFGRTIPVSDSSRMMP